MFSVYVPRSLLRRPFIATHIAFYTRRVVRPRSKSELTRLKAGARQIEWHLRQKPTTEGLSKNKQFKQIPISNAIMDYINKRDLGLRRKRPEKGKKEKENLFNTSTPGDINQATHNLFASRLIFIASAATDRAFPNDDLPEVAFIGRSNVGKSSLINTLTQSKQAYVSEVPGYTRTINWFRLAIRLHLVDLPGYGFAFATQEARTAWKNLIYQYLGKRRCLKRVMVLIDSRHGFKSSDFEILDFLERENTNCRYQIVLTKTDLVLPEDLARRWYSISQELEKRKKALKRVILVSSM